MKKFDTVEEYWTKEDIYEAARTADSSSFNLFEESLANYLGGRDLHILPSAMMR